MSRALPLIVLLLSLALPAVAQQIERQAFGDWTGRCWVDKMTDAQKYLVMSAVSAPVAFGFTNGNLDIVIVGRKHHPGSQVMLRIDSDPPLTSKEPGFTGREATVILDRFANAQRIRIRYREWPNKFVDGELSTNGFADALAHVRSASGVTTPAPKAPE
jgi:hypothetical protein